MARQPFSTRLDTESEPVWFPLEQVARLSRLSARVPAFYPCEFMYAGSLVDGIRGLGLWQFDANPRLFRSIPPEEWPKDELTI